ncbi:MAG: winged helix-turn-helix transcriptional regulator [Deltaproteobacteria bacterium]|nr:winged helix-turn-helix transcriptional regulator [Deltaproteobacteria bacterium]
MQKLKKLNPKIYEGQASILKALGQPTRLQILELLKEGERCVCEIFPAISQEQANVSKHLSILKQAGILESRKDGLRILYRIKTPEILDLLSGVSRLLKTQAREQHHLMTQI